MSKVIPKEQLTAYQRWELAPFDEHEAHNRLSPADFKDAKNLPSSSDGEAIRAALPTAEGLERMHQEAWQEGYNLGLEEGRKAGFASGAQAGEQYAQQLKSLAEALEAGLQQQNEQVAHEVLELALAVANQVVRTTLRLKPELILEAIREALTSLPAIDSHHRIIVHPDHAEMVKDWLAREHGHMSWKVVEDAQLDAGSFRFESAHSELDGNLKTRWQEIVDCLGADARWLD